MFKNPKQEKQVLLPKSRGLPIPNNVSLHLTRKQYVDSFPYSDYATMTQAVSQLECSFSQPSNRAPSIICLARKSGRPLIHANSLPQTQLSNKHDSLTNIQAA